MNNIFDDDDDEAAAIARELLAEHAHEPGEEEVEIILDMPGPQREPCTRAELEGIIADPKAHELERKAAREALERGDFLP